MSPADRLRDALRRTEELTRGRIASGRCHEDADDETGTIDSDDAIGFNPLPVLRALDEHRARTIVIGQVAGILHGSVELTGDLDLLWSGDEEDAPAVCAAFAAVDAELSDDDGGVLPVTIETFRRPKVMFRTANAAGDCCTPALPWGALDVGAFIERADSSDIDGTRVHYVARKDLNHMRLAVGRAKDVRRAAELG